MNWRFWTILIAAVLMILEYLVVRCLKVQTEYRGECHNIMLPIWLLILFIASIFIPILNLIVTVLIIPIGLPIYIGDSYYWELKDISEGENKENIMLRVLYFLAKKV